MQIRMKFRSAINAKSANKTLLTGSVIHMCSDCKVNLVKQQMELVCPNCGMVEQLIDGSE